MTDSLYGFLRRPVANEDLDTLVDAAHITCSDVLTPVWREHCVQGPIAERVPEFMGAPAALVFTTSSPLPKHAWLDYGMFLQSLRLAAEALGLAALPITNLDLSEITLREGIGVPPSTLLIGALAVGYLDPTRSGDSPSDWARPVTIRFLS